MDELMDGRMVDFFIRLFIPFIQLFIHPLSHWYRIVFVYQVTHWVRWQRSQCPESWFNPGFLADGPQSFMCTVSNFPDNKVHDTPAKPTWNRPQTDKNPQIRGEIGLQSALIRFCRFGVGLCSGRQICRGEIFQTCLKDLSPTNCRLSVGYMSVWCRFCRGAFGDVSVLIRLPMVDGLLVLDSLIHIYLYLT